MVPDPAGYAGPIDAADQTVEEALAPRHDVPSRGRSGFTVIEGRQVHYLEWGHRKLPPVLCLHGGGQTAYMFEELGAAVADRFHLVAPDLPYHGDSDPLVGEFDFGPQAIAESMLPLLDQFGMDRVALVGASLGGLTSIRLAAAHPERVVSIALIDVGHRLEPEGVRRIIDFMSPRVVRPARRSRGGDLEVPPAAQAGPPREPHPQPAPTVRRPVGVEARFRAPVPRHLRRGPPGQQPR